MASERGEKRAALRTKEDNGLNRVGDLLSGWWSMERRCLHHSWLRSRHSLVPLPPVCSLCLTHTNVTRDKVGRGVMLLCG